MADSTTLRHVLSQRKPVLPCQMRMGKKNSSREGWPQLQNCVKLWDEFNLNTLNESYGHLLDVALPEQVLVDIPEPRFEGVTIKIDTDINHLVCWNNALMLPTLQFAKEHLGLDPGVILNLRSTTANKSFIAKVPNAPPRTVVDHVIGLDLFPGQNLVVGLGRPSVKWDGRKAADRIDVLCKEQLWPVRQLANICKEAKTRYGYIQTDQDLVVCCFSNTSDNWKAAIRPIPWSTYGTQALTTDLALWWLCMLAMSGHHHRAIVEEEAIVKINEWDVIKLGDDNVHSWVRRHRYSNFEEPTSPPPLPAYTTPSPGNLAAFDAAVGFNANDWLNIDAAANADIDNLDPWDFNFTP